MMMMMMVVMATSAVANGTTPSRRSCVWLPSSCVLMPCLDSNRRLWKLLIYDGNTLPKIVNAADSASAKLNVCVCTLAHTSHQFPFESFVPPFHSFSLSFSISFIFIPIQRNRPLPSYDRMWPMCTGWLIGQDTRLAQTHTPGTNISARHLATSPKWSMSSSNGSVCVVSRSFKFSSNDTIHC